MPRRPVLAALLVLAAPAIARGGLLDARLSPPAALDLAVRAPPALAAGSPQSPGEGDLDFDLLGEPEPPEASPDAAAMRRRRKLLTLHQGVGIGLAALQVGTTAVGQLNYRDKFATRANTERFRTTHKLLAYGTATAFALNLGLALAAPEPPKRQGWRLDRVTAHRLAMFTAALGMATQVGLGIYTASREGHDEQHGLARVHLYVGWGTLAAMATGVGVLVF